MPSDHFSLLDAKDICLSPYLAQERGREAARQASDAAEAGRSAGVAWSGLGVLPSRAARTADEIRAAAEAALHRAAAFAESARGRFLLSLRALDQLGYTADAERARAAFARGFANPDRLACPSEIGVALTVLARLDQPAARAACLALAELLTDALKLAAE
jgi:hypothetical protein